MRSAAIILFLACSFAAFGQLSDPGRFAGAWIGTFNSQPTKLAPDGSYPEVVNRFRLELLARNRVLNGSLTPVTGTDQSPRPISHAGLFHNKLCFDVDLDQIDQRWCVVAKGDRMTGVWTNGPEGGKLLAGMGGGARLFSIQARRAR
ncbi:MAG TPA: hypothetical protein VG168_00940 [Bryobacteraceae bacterium]|nr:hypothetical protein [Bryobacteraceae bacterium]